MPARVLGAGGLQLDDEVAARLLALATAPEVLVGGDVEVLQEMEEGSGQERSLEILASRWGGVGGGEGVGGGLVGWRAGAAWLSTRGLSACVACRQR